MSNKKAYFFYQHVANEREKEQNKNTAETKATKMHCVKYGNILIFMVTPLKHEKK